MNEDSKIDELFQAYRAACPDVEPSANFMPNLWQRIEARPTFGLVFQNLARTTMAACGAICLLLVCLNFISVANSHSAQLGSYADVLMAEHTAEGTDYTEAIK